MKPLGAGVGAAVRAATETLDRAGVPSARHDAEALARHALGSSGEFDGGTQRRFDALVARRARREPLQHLTGTAPFRYVELAVGPGVFVPRPETEGLVDLVLADCGPDTVAVDLCSGSGAIALAIATERPGTVVHAVELSEAALPWLRRNVGGMATVHPVDLAATDLTGVDVVVCNPPYLPDGLAVEPEVAADPAAALWAGPDGLAAVRRLVPAAARMLRPGGLLALEHDAGHQPAVLDLLRAGGFEQVAGHRDLTGRDRYASGRMPA